MDLIQFQELHCFVDKALIWFYPQPCKLPHSCAPMNPKLTGCFITVFLDRVRFVKTGENGEMFTVFFFQKLKKARFFSYEIDFNSCTVPARALSYCCSNTLSIN